MLHFISKHAKYKKIVEMNLLKLFFALLIIIQICHTNEVFSRFIKDYYRSYNIHQIVVFACWDISDAVDFSRSIMELDTVLSYNTITYNLNLSNVLRVNYYHVGVLLDFDCPFSENVLQQFSNQLVFNESYFWLLSTVSSVMPIDTLKYLPLTIETEMTFALRGNSTYELYDIYNPSYRHGGKLNITYKGRWAPITGLTDELNQYKYKRRGDFHRMQLNFSLTLTSPPLPDLETYLRTPINPHLDILTRPQYTFVLYLQDMYNFSIKLHQAETWGYKINATTFNGIIGDMLAGFIDMSITPFKYKKERYSIVEFLIETWAIETAFLFRHPKSSNVRNNFITPFTNETWRMIAIVAVVYWTFLLISLKVELKYGSNTPQDESIIAPASETGLTTLAALSQQGAGNGPRIFSGRIVFLSLFLWSLLLFQFYSADIVGSLLTPSPRWIKNLRNLIDSDLELGCENQPYHIDFFMDTNNPIIQELRDKKLKTTKENPKSGFYPASVGYPRMKRGGFAFDADTARSYHIVTETFSEQEICELQQIVTTPTPTKLLLIVPKRSPFKKMIIYGVRQMIQSGLYDRIRKQWIPRRPTCPESFKSRPTPVGMKEFSPAIFLMCIGTATSIITLILEILVCQYKQRGKTFANDTNSENLDNKNITEVDDEDA